MEKKTQAEQIELMKKLKKEKIMVLKTGQQQQWKKVKREGGSRGFVESENEDGDDKDEIGRTKQSKNEVNQLSLNS